MPRQTFQCTSVCYIPEKSSTRLYKHRGMESESEKFKNIGNKYFKEGDYITALTKYTEAIVLDRNNPVLYSNRSLTFLKLQSWNNAIDDCHIGLELLKNKPDAHKLKSKLFWRLSNGLRNKGEVDEAFRIVKDALNFDPNNKELQLELEVLEEMLSKKSQVPETPTLQEKPTVQEKSDTKSSIINIPIESVDTIPSSFFQSSPQSNEHKPDKPFLGTLGTSEPKIAEPQVKRMKPLIEEIEQLKPDTNITNTEQPPEVEFPAKHIQNDSTHYPLHPTIQFLLGLKSDQSLSLPSYYQYILEVSKDHYAFLFNTTGVEPEILEFFMDACIYVLENNHLEYKVNILQLLRLFRSLPRFTLNAMFADAKKVSKLQTLFKTKLNENFGQYWS